MYSIHTRTRTSLCGQPNRFSAEWRTLLQPGTDLALQITIALGAAKRRRAAGRGDDNHDEEDDDDDDDRDG